MVSGRDLQQTNLLVNKYLRHGDIYVHADVSDASMCVIRSKDKRAFLGMEGHGTSSMTPLPVSPIAIQEAGMMVICRSSAWKSKNNGASPW